MSKKPRGYAFVWSNTKFPDQPRLKDRTGGDVDLINISELLKGLSFQTDVVEEKNATEIKDEVRRFTNRDDHRSAECSVVVLMSHGEEGHICGTDGQLVALEDIFAMFDEHICLLLKGKPKLFFIQACRGEKVYKDEADGIAETTELDLMGELRRLLRQPSQVQDLEVDSAQAVQRPHVFCGYSTKPGYVAFRNTEDGSWFIQDITSVFMKNAKEKSLDEMMTEVKEKVLTRKTALGGKEEAESLSLLQKDLYFFPGQ
ncbi:CASP2 [Branchiostoma lanceolatum]|uniref:CASP2 protein n=1 Tax=Branchiostoma lanceolatum TaxID=7740 RepID=A0A8J9YRP1_BRALA|nr:CASP2 [Branchiostoma lanceolatum]